MRDRGITVRRAGRPEHAALLVETHLAQKAMRAAGFSIADSDTPLDMVKKLIVRNQYQESLMAALRERLKAAEAALIVVVEKGATGRACPFWRDSGACKARAGYAHCAEHHEEPDERHQLRDRPPCRLDEGPILVKKAESEESDGPEKLSGLAAAVEEAHRANGVYLLHCVKEWIDRRRATPEGGES